LPGLPAAESAGPSAAGPGPYKVLKRLAIQAFEREYLVRLLRDSEGNVTRAAHLAGKERRDLGRLLNRHKLDPGHFAHTRVRSPPPGALAPRRPAPPAKPASDRV